MGRRPTSDKLLLVRAGDRTLELASSVVAALPDAAAFIDYLCLDRCAPATAIRYASVVAKLKRVGRLNEPDTLPAVFERTAARAYWRWVGSHYDERLAAVHKVLWQNSRLDARSQLGQLRMHSLVPPQPGKVVPHRSPPTNETIPGAPIAIDESSPPRWQPPPPVKTRARWEGWTIKWMPTDRWTLHLPAKGAPPHVDPCADCDVVELDDAELQAIAEAFYKAWGREKTPMQMPPELFLFGPPPPTSAYAAPAPSSAGSIVALVPTGPLCDNVEHLKGSATPSALSFADRLRERNPDAVVIDRRALGNFAPQVATALHAWLTQAAKSTEVDEPAQASASSDDRT